MSMIRELRTVVRRNSADPLVPRPAAAPPSAVVDCAIYRDGARVPGAFSPSTALREVRSGGRGFVWIGLHEPSEPLLAEIGEQYDLHPLAVEDAVQAEHQRPKLDRYDDMLFAVFKTVRYIEHAELTATSEVVETGEVMAFVGRDFVVTVRHGEHGDLRGLRRRLQADPELLGRGPSAILHAVADRIVDDYLLVTEHLQSDIDEVESAVFSPRRSRDAERIYQLKREVLELKRAVTPLATPLQTLAERPMRLVEGEIREYFRDVHDHLTSVAEQVSDFDELLTTIVAANLAQVTVAQNEDMRKITAWVAIFAVPTMIAGIYGMNFEHMPELGWRYGYFLVMAVMVGTCLLMYRGFRRNRWL